MSYWRKCPRCNDRSYEVLRTHAHCVSCNYSPDLLDRPMSPDDLPIPEWAENLGDKTAKEEGDESEPSLEGAA